MRQDTAFWKRSRIGIALAAALFGMIAGGGLALDRTGSRAEAAAPLRYNRTFGNVFYAVPAGFRAAQDSGGIVMIRAADAASGSIGGALLLTQGFVLSQAQRRDIRNDKKNFVQQVAIAAGDLTSDPGAKISAPTAVNDTAKDRYEAFAMSAVAHDKTAGQKRFMSIVVVLTPTRAEAFLNIGYGSEARMRSQGPAFDALVGSIEFRDAGAPPPRAAAPLPRGLASLMPPPKARPAPAPAPSAPGQSASRGGTGRNCRTVQRQMCSGGIGTSLGYFCNTYPQRVCD